ncbi:ATP-binding protein [Promicromonospora sp. Marseille-Q5078]
MFSATHVPEGFREVRSWPLFTIDDLSALRDQLGTTLPGGPRASLEEVPESVVMVASELATNALCHGRGPVTVRLSARGDELLLEVVDRDPEHGPQIVSARPVGEGGFGLLLAARLADETGWWRTRQAKHVWARFTVHANVPSLAF